MSNCCNGRTEPSVSTMTDILDTGDLYSLAWPLTSLAASSQSSSTGSGVSGRKAQPGWPGWIEPRPLSPGTASYNKRGRIKSLKLI